MYFVLLLVYNVKSSLVLQMALYFNLTYFPVWLVINISSFVVQVFMQISFLSIYYIIIGVNCITCTVSLFQLVRLFDARFRSHCSGGGWISATLLGILGQFGRTNRSTDHFLALHSSHSSSIDLYPLLDGLHHRPIVADGQFDPIPHLHRCPALCLVHHTESSGLPTKKLFLKNKRKIS